MTENQLQRQIVNYLESVLPKTHRAFAVPNASRRTAGGRASNAVPGLRPGVPDLMIVGQGRAFMMEVKAPKGKLSDAQNEWAMWATNAGMVPWALVRSVDDVRTCLTVWGIPTREHRIY